MSSRSTTGGSPEAQPPQGSYPSRRELRQARVAAERVGDPTVVSMSDPFAMVMTPAAPQDTHARGGRSRVGGLSSPRRRELRSAAPRQQPARQMATDGSAFDPSVPDARPLPVPVPSAEVSAFAGPREAAPVPAAAFSLHAAQARPEDAHGSIDTGEVAPVGDWLTPTAEGGPHAPGAVEPDRQAPSPRSGFSLRDRDGAARMMAEMRAVPVTRWLPQAGVVAVMAAATVGNSMAGPFQPSAPGDAAASAFAPARDGVRVDVGAPDQPVASDLEAASDVVQGEDGILRARAADEASRDGSRSPLPGCSGVPPERALSNGDVPEEHLCTLSNGSDRLRADAAVAFTLLSEAYARHFGRDICVTSSYRTYAQQVAVKREKGWLAARPGTSEHGYGLAVDLCGGVEAGGEAYWWLRENAPAFGWDNPSWARPEGSKTELWHWEYVAGQAF